MEVPAKSKNKWLGIFESAFWIAFIIIPIFTGVLAYHWLPNESPILAGDQVVKPYKILQSHEVCPDNGQCETVADVWQNTDTGNVYTKADFQSHRESERNRMTISWFIYGLIGCLFFAGLKYYKKEDFYKYFGMAVMTDLAIAAFTYLTANVNV
jgi:hypothetical protein